MNPDINFRSPQPQYPQRHKSAYIMVFIFLAIVTGGYILFRLSTFFAGPTLELMEPTDGANIRGGFLAIKGMAEPKTRVTINGYEVVSDDNGHFSVDLPIAAGFQIVDVRVKNRVGQETRVVRKVVVE